VGFNSSIIFSICLANSEIRAVTFVAVLVPPVGDIAERLYELALEISLNPSRNILHLRLKVTEAVHEMMRLFGGLS